MEKSLNKFAIVADSVMHFPLLRIDERIPLFFRFIDIIDLMPFQVFFISSYNPWNKRRSMFV